MALVRMTNIVSQELLVPHVLAQHRRPFVSVLNGQGAGAHLSQEESSRLVAAAALWRHHRVQQEAFTWPPT